MSYSDVMPFAAGLLQFGVACYTLRLLRLFGAPRAGWQAFGALAGLAVLCYLLFPFSPVRNTSNSSVDLIYAAISLLLLAALVHVDTRFRKRLAADGSERRAQSEWEAQAEQEFQKLARYNEELRLAAKRQSAETARSTQELQEAIGRLQVQVAEHERKQQELQANHDHSLRASHQAGKTELAQQVLSHLAEVKTLARQQANSIKTRFAQAAKQLQPATRATHLKRPPRGQRMSGSLAHLALSVSAERSQILNRIESLRQHLIETTGIAATSSESIVIDAALPAETPDGTYAGPTETATHSEAASDVRNGDSATPDKPASAAVGQ